MIIPIASPIGIGQTREKPNEAILELLEDHTNFTNCGLGGIVHGGLEV